MCNNEKKVPDPQPLKMLQGLLEYFLSMIINNIPLLLSFIIGKTGVRLVQSLDKIKAKGKIL